MWLGMLYRGWCSVGRVYLAGYGEWMVWIFVGAWICLGLGRGVESSCMGMIEA